MLMMMMSVVVAVVTRVLIIHGSIFPVGTFARTSSFTYYTYSTFLSVSRRTSTHREGMKDSFDVQ